MYDFLGDYELGKTYSYIYRQKKKGGVSYYTKGWNTVAFMLHII